MKEDAKKEDAQLSAAVSRPWAHGRARQAGRVYATCRPGYRHLATSALSLCFWSIAARYRLSPGIGL